MNGPMEADLAIVEAAELVTVTGPAPRVGAGLREPGIVPGGCVAVRDGLIVFIGSAREYRIRVRLSRHGVEIDARGRTVLPGFVDPHTHLPFAGSREDGRLVVEDRAIAGKGLSDLDCPGSEG